MCLALFKIYTFFKFFLGNYIKGLYGITFFFYPEMFLKWLNLFNFEQSPYFWIRNSNKIHRFLKNSECLEIGKTNMKIMESMKFVWFLKSWKYVYEIYKYSSIYLRKQWGNRRAVVMCIFSFLPVLPPKVAKVFHKVLLCYVM